MREYLKAIRKGRNLTQCYVATASGISEPYYSQLENGRRGSHIDLILCAKMAEVLGVPFENFTKMELAWLEVNR